MRDRLGILLIEDETGEVSVQLFSNPDVSFAAFKELTSEKKIRGTYVKVDWSGNIVESWSKELPTDGIGERMDYWEVGKGPVFRIKPMGIQG